MSDTKQMPVLADGMVLHCGAPNGLTMCKKHIGGMVPIEPIDNPEHYKRLGYVLCEGCNTAVLAYMEGVIQLVQDLKAGLHVS